MLGGLKQLLISDSEKTAKQNFIDVFGYIFHKDFNIEDLLYSSEESNILLVRISDRKDTDKMEIGELVLNLYTLAEVFMLNLAKILNNDWNLALDLDNLLDKHFSQDDSRRLTSFLREEARKIRANRNYNPHPRYREQFVSDVKHLFVLHLKNLHEAQNLEFPVLEGKMKWDVFVSYNKRDLEEVTKICEDLKQEGIVPWFDEWALQPGKNWREEIEKAIEDENIKAAIICVGKHGIGKTQREEQDYILSLFGDKPVIPIILASSDKNLSNMGLLGNRSGIDFKQPKHFVKLKFGVTGENPNYS